MSTDSKTFLDDCQAVYEVLEERGETGASSSLKAAAARVGAWLHNNEELEAELDDEETEE